MKKNLVEADAIIDAQEKAEEEECKSKEEEKVFDKYIDKEEARKEI